MSFFAQRTPHLNAFRPSPYDTGHEKYTYNAPNYYPRAEEPFALEWNLAGTPEFPGGNPDFTARFEFPGGTLDFPDGYPVYDSSASSPESIQFVEAPYEAPPERPKRVNRRGPDHIPRPRNAFMIFRSELCTSGKISKKVEGDNRHISITAAAVWKAFSEEEKKPYQIAAELEKLEHKRLYPNYRFTPTVRATKPVKRKVNRNGQKDIERSRQVAQLILAGKEGHELEEAVRDLDEGAAAAAEFIPSELPPPNAPSAVHGMPMPEVRGWVPHNGVPETVDVPGFIPCQVVPPVTLNVPVPPPRDQHVPNYSATLPPGWPHLYTGKPRDPSIPRRPPTPSTHVLIELYEDIKDRPMRPMVSQVVTAI
ncbi:hypothetical protein C8R45DRAFT_17012 [Mycena sanguinolenta]|nr:hypothetical protein C8R45DRAFT_17012 [Mycena sanguinolenta]